MSEKVDLIINYNPGWYLYIPDMTVTIKENTYSIAKHKSLTITIDKGEYDILFKSGFRKKKYHAVLNDNKQLEIGWSRLWGTIRIKEIITHVTL